MDPRAEGKTYPDRPFTIEPSRVSAFRAVVGEDEGDGVPPTFVTAAEFSVLPEVIGDPELALDFSRILHGSQEYVFERPLRLGETLTIRCRLASIRVRAGTGFLTIATDLVDGDGELVCRARSTMVERA
jgi:N-terminal half of MaoC dehydratase